VIGPGAKVYEGPTVTAEPLTTAGTKSKTLRFIVARFREASTYRGLMLILTGLGVALRPEVGEAIVACGMAAAGLIGVLLPDTTEP
jgi:hypothetical protein